VARSPMADYDDPFLRIDAIAEPPRTDDKRLQLIVQVTEDGRISDDQLALLLTRDPQFPSSTGLRLPTSGPAIWLLDQNRDPLAIAVPKSHDATSAFSAGARSGTLLEPGSRTLLTATMAMPAEMAQSFADGLLLGSHQAKRPQYADAAEVLVLVDDTATMESVQRGIAVTRSVLFARDLANMPSNVKTPQWLADQASGLAGDGLEVSSLDQDALNRLGMGGILAVGAGSTNPPNVILLRWHNTDTQGRKTDLSASSREEPGPRVIVGKGITFDSGGISLKPGTSMPLMKTDMAGGAAVLGTFASLKSFRPQTDVVGLVACAENMPSGSAMRPGDVITHYGGRTTEVLNTDAEGRLVLADCLSYAARNYRPSAMVDLATLTGSATLGLGRSHAPLYCDSPELCAQLEAAALIGGEKVWQMPLVTEYRRAIASQVADSANANTDPHISAGSITAALFLQPFAGGIPWAHLDIAGTGRRESVEPGKPKGATGFGVRLLTEWLLR
jgi:leucyl aminopeptidase